MWHELRKVGTSGHLAAQTAISYPFGRCSWNNRLPSQVFPQGPIQPPAFLDDMRGLSMDATSSTKNATLTVGNKTYDFPVYSGTVGPDVVDIAKLYAQSGMFTYDP